MHDALGRPLSLDDTVLVPARITQLSPSEDYCNVSIETVNGRRPDGQPETISAINTGVMLKISGERLRAYEAIETERDYQDAGKGNAQRHPEAPKAMSVGEFILCMDEYLAKARAAWSKSGGVPPSLHDIRKVTALGVQCVELHGAPPRS